MSSCRECCYAAPTGANLYCSMNECYVGELTCDEFEPIVKPKTNYDRIHAMSEEELAKFLSQECDFILLESETRKGCFSGLCSNKGCIQCVLDWLREEAKDRQLSEETSE